MVRRAWILLIVVLGVLSGLGLRGVAGPAALADDAPAPLVHGPSGVACVHCHVDPHAGAGGETCQTCHATETWTPALFTVVQHEQTAFPLEGRHQRVACGRCHVDARLVGLPQACNECHLDRHRGKLGDQCQECHSPSGFVPTLVTFDHEAHVGFALTGAHAVGCPECHEGDNGRAMRVVQDATCSTCHAPAHGDFGPCEDCHDPAKGVFAGTSFDHGRETPFRLERRHAAQACTACHPVGSDIPDDRCASCHVDVHAGQLGTACTDCHRPDRWRLVRFDHDRTLFPLRGRHFVAPCGSCHTNDRWVGLRTDCFECHVFELQRAPAFVPAHTAGLADCGGCHNTWTWR